MNSKVMVFAAAALLLAAAPGAADDEAAPAIMEEVVVTATRQQEPKSKVPADVTVLSRSDVAQSTAENVAELLQSAAGVHVFDITGNRRSYRVDLRGFGETALLNTTVLVDGRRINNPDLSGTDWALIPLDRIERIEIVRGGRGGVFYGDNATAGTINIITRRGDRFEADADIAAGSYRTYDANAFVGGSEKGLSYALSAGFFGTDGYRDNAGTEAKDLGASLDYLASDRVRLYLNTGYHNDNSNLPGALKKSDFDAGASRTDTLHPLDYTDTEDVYLQGGPELTLLKDSLARFDISYRKRTATSYSTGSWGFFNGDTRIDTVAVSPQVVLNEPFFSMGNSFSVGFDFSNAKEWIKNRAVYYGAPSTGDFDLEKRNSGLFAHDSLTLAEGLSVSAGYRMDRVEYTFLPSTPTRSTHDEEALTTGINYEYARGSNVYASYSQSFRYPVIDELYSFFTNTVNSSLMPQTSDDYEIGVRHILAPGTTATLNLFRLDTKDEIYFNPNTFLNQNLDGKARREGVEASLEKDFGVMTARATYTYNRPRIVGGQFEGNTVPMVPEHQASADFMFRISEQWALFVNGSYVGERYFESDYRNAFERLDDYIVVNARVEYRWKQFTAYVKLNNLTNAEYSEYGVLSAPPVQEAYYPSPKFNFLAGVKAGF